MSATISLAKQESTGSIQHINEVDKGQRLTFICVGCSKVMIVVKSEARKRDWHFRHEIESSCTGGRDTALHDYAVQVLMESKVIRISKNLNISYSNPRKEVIVFGKRSDATVTHENVDVHFEVFVTHDLDQDKISIYKNNKVKCVRIDLSNPDLLAASSEAIKEAILEHHKNKSVVYWKDEVLHTKTEEADWGKYVLGFLTFIGIAFIVNRIFRRYKKISKQ